MTLFASRGRRWAVQFERFAFPRWCKLERFHLPLLLTLNSTISQAYWKKTGSIFGYFALNEEPMRLFFGLIFCPMLTWCFPFYGFGAKQAFAGKCTVLLKIAFKTPKSHHTLLITSSLNTQRKAVSALSTQTLQSDDNHIPDLFVPPAAPFFGRKL